MVPYREVFCREAGFEHEALKFEWVEFRALVEEARSLGLEVDGLMTVGPTDRPAEDARPGFRLVRELVDELDLAVCSMGMTGDLDVAVEEGSTSVRLGTALFGPRPPR